MPEPVEPGGFSWTQFRGVGPGLDVLGPLDGQVVAEIGCGSGRTAAAVARCAATVTGVDVDSEVLATARDAYPEVAFVAGDAASILRSRPGAFDVVLSKFGAIDFAHRLGTLLSCVRAALAPGGRLVMSSRHPRWEAACQHIDLPGTGRTRNLLDRHGWHGALHRHGLRPTFTEELHVPELVLASYLVSLRWDRELSRELAPIPSCIIVIAEAASP